MPEREHATQIQCEAVITIPVLNLSPEVIRVVGMTYVRFPLSLRNVEDLLFERGIDICYETVGHWWSRFGPLFAADVRRQRVGRMRGFPTGVGTWMRCT